MKKNQGQGYMREKNGAQKKLIPFSEEKKSIFLCQAKKISESEDFEVVPQFKIGIYYAYCIISIVNVFISKAPTLSIYCKNLRHIAEV